MEREMWIEYEKGETVAFVYWGMEKGNRRTAEVIGCLSHCELKKIVDGMTCALELDDRFVENPEDAPRNV